MKFVCLHIYDDYVEANIILGRLQSQDINSWLQDENLVTVFPGLTNAVGGIKLMVAENQVERATELLRQLKDEKE